MSKVGRNTGLSIQIDYYCAFWRLSCQKNMGAEQTPSTSTCRKMDLSKLTDEQLSMYDRLVRCAIGEEQVAIALKRQMAISMPEPPWLDT